MTEQDYIEEIESLKNEVSYYKNKCENLENDYLMKHFIILRCMNYLKDYIEEYCISDDPETWDNEIRDIYNIMKEGLQLNE